MNSVFQSGFETGPTLTVSDAKRIERSCVSDAHPRLSAGIVHSPSTRGIERIEARFHGNGYSPHRHDTYAIGVTLSGVQTFAYRGASRFSMPGNIIVLHPDEVHDGAAGTDDGLRYRMLYLPPERLIEATDGPQALPFVKNPVLNDSALQQCLRDFLSDLDTEPDGLTTDDLQARLTDLLWQHANGNNAARKTIAREAVLRARDHLHENSAQSVTSQELEAVSGLDRFTLARHFRALLGTSPHRYLVMRRLEKSRTLMAHGLSLSEAALACSFADQAHFTRHFKGAFGMTPGRWRGLTQAGVPK